MEPPVPLDGPARVYWDRHANRLKAAGTLTDADTESFALLCVTWGMLCRLQKVRPGAKRFRELIQFTNLQKQYQALAKQFGLLPRDRKASKMAAGPEPAKDEFGL